ncbi:MAG: HEAT repeat domain-containing protein [Acidobacteria bacterium]|nr:HEAT repeat domain-containing protein [Acidobacteriota bacterium]
MSQASQLSPELARGVLQLARGLIAAMRNWALYPPEHPAVGQSVKRLADALRENIAGGAFSLGVTPTTLMVGDAPADQSQGPISEAAAFLHDRDVLQISFLGDVPVEALHAFLRIMALDPTERRNRGGPAQIWLSDGHPSMVIEQIDYKRVLERERAGETPEPAKRDDVWRSIVTSIAGGQTGVFDEAAQRRLLAISESPGDITDLAGAVMAPKCAMDGSPMITSQAATVLAAFRHLAGIVTVRAPDNASNVMGNLATAAANLDPHVVMQVMQHEEEPGAQVAVVRGMAAAFDDVKVAQLLATALALDGQASDRLATIFNTIAPDEDRKRRVLTLTRSMLGETDFGKQGQFSALWTSMEELLVSYNDKPYVSETYKAALDGVGGRAERMATTDLPPELSMWIDSLGQENVRSLSVTLLIDLLTLERDATRAEGIAQDMGALAEDLLMSGSYDDAQSVTKALRDRAAKTGAMGRDACRQALDRLGDSLAMRETVALIAEMDDRGWETIRTVIATIGPACTEALTPVVAVEKETIASKRAEEIIIGFGPSAIPRLASLVGNSRWFAQVAGARVLGKIGTAAAVPLLQPLLRKSDPRVTVQAIASLSGIQDPAAARAVQTVLRSTTGDTRKAVVDALVTDRDQRVVPMLVQILNESEPLGTDHDVVLETLDALGRVGSDTAVPALAKAAGVKGWFVRAKRTALKKASVDALVRIGTPKAKAALDNAGRTGDRLLKKIVHGTAKG